MSSTVDKTGPFFVNLPFDTRSLEKAKKEIDWDIIKQLFFCEILHSQDILEFILCKFEKKSLYFTRFHP